GAEEDLVVAREGAADEGRGEVLGLGLRGPAGPEVGLLDLLDDDGEASPGVVDVGAELLDQVEGEQAELSGGPGEAGVDELVDLPEHLLDPPEVVARLVEPDEVLGGEGVHERAAQLVLIETCLG